MRHAIGGRTGNRISECIDLYLYMELKAILSQAPGIQRQFVYYLEAQGYIRPRKIRQARIARRDYSPEDARIVAETWRYCQRGYSVQAAYELISRAERVTAYITLPVRQQ